MTERVLFVCTANQGRSALAEGLFRARAGQLVPDAPVEASSAGLMEGGVPVSEPVADAARRLGADLGRHRSQRLTGEAVDEADLVVAMAGEHAREVLALRAEAERRTFTLRELARRAAATGPRGPGEPLSDYLARLDQASPSGPPGDDVEDPYGKPLSALADTAAEIDRLVSQVLDHLWAPWSRGAG